MKKIIDRQLVVEPSDLPEISTHPHLATVVQAWLVNGKYRISLAVTRKVRHLRIRRLDDLPITEYDIFQKIKNQFFGENIVAVQVFPDVNDYINNTNTYHLFTWEGIEVPNLKLMYSYLNKKSNG